MSLTQSQPRSRWDGREMPLLNVLPYVLLVISTAMAVGIDHGNSTKVIIDIVGAAAAAAWMLWFVTLHPEMATAPGADGRVLRRPDGDRRRAGAQ